MLLWFVLEDKQTAILVNEGNPVIIIDYIRDIGQWVWAGGRGGENHEGVVGSMNK